MPECSLGFICDAALDIGIGHISWQTLHYYQSVKAHDMTWWESDAIMMIGREFSDGVSEYHGKACDSPWPDYQADQEMIANAARAALLG